MPDGDALTDVIDRSGNGKGIALNVFPYSGTPIVYATRTAFPLVGMERNLYVADDTETTYRWSNSLLNYIEISPNLGGLPTPFVATRSELAALSTATYGRAYLTEANREGLFVFDTANLSAQVTADTQQGIYIAPASAPTGASGAWVRKFDGPLNVKWFGAVLDGIADDGPALQVAQNMASSGATIDIPGPAKIATMVNVTKSLTFRGRGRKMLLTIPDIGFDIQAPNVHFEHIGFVGDRSAGNIAIRNTGGHARITMFNVWAEKFERFCTIDGGYGHSFTSMEVRNMVLSTWKLDKNPGGASGNDAFFDDIIYDTDTGTYAEPESVIDVLDFDYVVTTETCDFIHGGGHGCVYVHPATASGSSNHQFNHAGDTTVGAGVKIAPGAASYCSRIAINGWISTCGIGVLVEGAGQITTLEIGAKARFHHNRGAGVFWNNANAAGNNKLIVRNASFKSNNVNNDGSSDITLAGNISHAEITGNTFGIGMGWTDQSAYFVNIASAGVIEANIDRNTFQGTGRLGKINGLTTPLYTTQNNTGFKTTAGGQATIASGQTSTGAIAHGLDRTPSIKDIQLTYQSVSRGTTAVRPLNVTATTFEIASEAVATGGDCIINWAVRYLP